MWHPTTETPREGAKVVVTDAALRYTFGGIFSHGMIGCGRFVRARLDSYTHWAYAPGEEAE